MMNLYIANLDEYCDEMWQWTIKLFPYIYNFFIELSCLVKYQPSADNVPFESVRLQSQNLPNGEVTWSTFKFVFLIIPAVSYLNRRSPVCMYLLKIQLLAVAASNAEDLSSNFHRRCFVGVRDHLSVVHHSCASASLEPAHLVVLSSGRAQLLVVLNHPCNAISV